MNQSQHEKACRERFGEAFPEVHAFLDQYFKLTRSMSHRVILHHQRGIEMVVQKFGEEVRGPAEQHIEMDLGYIPEDHHDMERFYCPTTQEEDDLIKEQLNLLYGPPSDGEQKDKK